MTTSAPVPPEAVEAAAKRVNDAMWMVAGDFPDATVLAARRQLLTLALDAATPAIIAAHRKHLAAAIRAHYGGDGEEIATAIEEGRHGI